jgi:hypothetical protein
LLPDGFKGGNAGYVRNFPRYRRLTLSIFWGKIKLRNKSRDLGHGDRRGTPTRDKVGELFVHLDEPSELAILLVIDAIALSGRAGRGRLQSRQFGAVDSALLLQPVFDLAN